MVQIWDFRKTKTPSAKEQQITIINTMTLLENDFSCCKITQMRQLFAIFETGFKVHLIRCKVFANACTPKHLFFSISSVRQSLFGFFFFVCLRLLHGTQDENFKKYHVFCSATLLLKLTEVFKKGLNAHDSSLARSQIRVNDYCTPQPVSMWLFYHHNLENCS